MTRTATVSIDRLHVRCGYRPPGPTQDCGAHALYAVRLTKPQTTDWGYRCVAHAAWWAQGLPVDDVMTTVDLPLESAQVVGLPKDAILSVRDDADHVYDDADDEAAQGRPHPAPERSDVGTEFVQQIDAWDGDPDAVSAALAADNDYAITIGRKIARDSIAAAADALDRVHAAMADLRGDGVYDVEVAEGMRHASFHLQAARAHVDALKADIERNLT